MYILGVSESHNSTLCLLKDGKILYCISEERLTRRKNEWGFPLRAYEYVMGKENIGPNDLDSVVLSMRNPIVYLHAERQGVDQAADSLVKAVAPGFKTVSDYLMYKYAPYEKLYNVFYDVLYKKFFWQRLENSHLGYLDKRLGIPARKVCYVDHHKCHAFSVYFALRKDADTKYLVLTLDGIGDSTCGSINLAHGTNISCVADVPNGKSLARLYGWITHYMGMKINEHEYKVMGLAPYADKKGSEEVYKILKDLIWTDGTAFNTRCNSELFYFYLKKHLERKRFDWIAGGVQKLTEELLVSWVRAAIERFGIKDILVSGGIFMNIKANKALMEMPELDSIDVMPSAGDESNAIGAAYYGYMKACGAGKCKPFLLDNIYLGQQYTNEEVFNSIKSNNLINNSSYLVSKEGDIEQKIAQLLAKGEIVARFKGRMEFGARALGNRSILANPKDYSVVRLINEQIKCRDFWMPFACTILDSREKDYVLNPKGVRSYYMMLGFDTTEAARRNLRAAIHPYDYTARPQMLTKAQNPSYYKLIKYFEDTTGIGGVLNTSFNIHGEPIVCSPQDAIHTLKDSGLRHLAIEDYLVSKK